MTTTFFIFLGFIALLVGGGYSYTRKWEDTPSTALMKRTDDVNELTAKYNEVVKILERGYKFHKDMIKETHSSKSTRQLKSEFSQQYEDMEREYRTKRTQLLVDWEKSHPMWAKSRKMWGWIFVVGVIGAFVSCFHDMPVEEEAPQAVSSAMSDTQEKYWNAENIPIPYLQDSNQYVSNPDYVLKQESVDRMNIKLKQLENELDIQSVVIVVNHIENDDPFRMAQDVGNKYGVGRNDKGLVIVCGYEDHSINISPGKRLEGDLTDAECHRLEQQYVVPAMRANMPDSAMIYLTDAIYSLMKKKELPQMANLTSLSDKEDDQFFAQMGLYLLFLIAWGIFFMRLNRKYQWMGLVGTTALLSNPFYTPPRTSGGGGSSFGGFRGGGGGGGFSGGSFGGGSFGGGGATSRW